MYKIVNDRDNNSLPTNDDNNISDFGNIRSSNVRSLKKKKSSNTTTLIAIKRRRRRHMRNFIFKIFIFLILFVATIFVIKYFTSGEDLNLIDNLLIPDVDQNSEQIPLEANTYQNTGPDSLAFDLKSDLFIDSTTMEGNLYFANYWQSSYPAFVRIYINGKSEYIYQSKIIMPNNFIEKIKIDNKIEVGSYKGVAKIYTYDPISKNQKEVLSKKINININ